MTTFAFTELVNGQPADVVSAALGVNAAGKFVAADIGKPVKLGTVQNYVLAAAGDDIEGFVKALDAYTVNDGFSFGAVLRNTCVVATVDAAQVGNIAVGALVVAGASAALGTADAYPKVKSGAPVTYKWRVLRIITGAGAAGSTILIEKV